MNRLLSSDLWKYIKKLARRPGSKRAAIAYVTSDAYLRFGHGDMLVTDASDGAIKSGQTSARILSEAKKRGAEIYSLGGLHAKLLVIDGVAIVGSANASVSSANGLIEAAMASDDPSAVAMAISLLEQLPQQAIKVNEAFIKRIKKLPVSKKTFRTKVNRTTVPVRLRTPQTWILGISELKREFPDEATAAESGTRVAEANLSKTSSDTSWIRFTGNSNFRKLAKKGDTVIQIWTERHRKTPSVVYRHSPIVHRQEEPKCTRFYVEDYASAERTSLSWQDFARLTKRVGIGFKIGPRSVRAISQGQSQALANLWDE